MALPMFGDRKPFTVVSNESGNSSPRFSPDGRWITYNSNDSKSTQVYALSFPDGKKRYQVSTDGGIQAVWTRGGREIIYRSGTTPHNTLSSVSVEAKGDSLVFGAPRALFPTNFSGGPGSFPFDVSRDGRSIFAANIMSNQAEGAITLVQHWLEATRK
jgi:hypothetical protein